MSNDLVVRQEWNKLFDSMTAQIQALFESDEKSLVLDFNVISLRAKVLQAYLEKDPQGTLLVAEAELNSKHAGESAQAVNVRVRGLPKGYDRIPDKFDSKDINKLIQFQDAMVISASSVSPRCTVAVWECKHCMKKREVVQDTWVLQEPLECTKDDGGCGKKNTGIFDFVEDESMYVNAQTVEIQANPEQMGSSQVGRATVELDDDLVDLVRPGERVNVVGFQKIRQRKSGGEKLTKFHTYIKGLYLEKLNESDMTITPEDLSTIEDMKNAGIMELLVESIAPSIEGCSDVKLALGLQLFCSESVEEEGNRIRGQFHVLLVGDPSTAKSKLIQRVSEFHPHSIYSTGRGSTGVGLTAGIVKTGRDNEKTVLEAGAVVLGNGGLVCIDEFDKMDKADYGNMYEAMEQQHVSIHKAGFHCTLPSKCAIVAAANPKRKFDHRKALAEQFDIDPPVLSRFALIFCIVDEINADKDAKIAERIINNHWNRGSISARFSPSIWRKYVSLAKKIKPKFNKDEIFQHLMKNYVSLRETSERKRLEGINYRKPTPRQLEDIIRISEAVARLYLDEEGKIEYVDIALSLMKASLNESDEEIYAKMKYEDMSKVEQIVEVVKELRDEDGVSNYDAVLEELENRGMKKAESQVGKLIIRGDVILRPRYDRLRLI